MFLNSISNKACEKLNFCRKKKAEKEFEDLTKISIQEFISMLDVDMLEATKKLFQTDIKFYKGVNNLFFLNHRYEGKIKFVTKLESCHLAERELAFLEWQKSSLNRFEFIAPELVCCKRVGDSDICALSMECLIEPTSYSPAAIVELYHRIGGLTSELSSFTKAENKDGMFLFDMLANTKITRTIKYIVTKMHLPEAYAQALEFMDKRQAVFLSRLGDFQRVKQFISDSACLTNEFDVEQHYGLLHGDFKKANILSDESGKLKVIDLQYYNYGARLWDMAFLCSKEKEKYEETFTKFIEPLNLDDVELKIFVFLYVLASLLHVKKSNLSKLLFMKVFPAISSVDTQHTVRE